MAFQQPKNLLYWFIVFFIRLARYTKNGLVFLLGIIWRFVWSISEFLIHEILYRFYKLFHIVKKIFNFTLPYSDQISKEKQQIKIFFIIIIFVSVGLLSYDIFGEKVPSDQYGRGSIFYYVFGDPGFEQSTETMITTQSLSNYSIFPDEVALRREHNNNFYYEEILPTVSEDETALMITSLRNSNLGISRSAILSHEVLETETLSSIAVQYGISVNTLLWANNLNARSIIRPGQKLTILPVNGILYTITKGDNLDKVAKKYQSNAESIIEVNKLADATDIQVGQNIIIPNGVMPITVVPRSNNAPAIANNTPKPSAANPNSGTRFLWPLKSTRITQYFGYRHTGIDVGDKVGNPIYAAESGKVLRVRYDKVGYGYHIIIDHGGNIQTLYGHTSKIFVEPGQTVARGDVIALIGSTGRSTGPHLHFEVRMSKGGFKNPLDYLR